MTLDEKEAPMNSMENPQVNAPNAALAARADETLAHAYEQIARADEQLVRVTEQLSKMERDAVRSSPALDRRPPHERSAFRGLTGLLLTACIVGAAFLLQSPYGDTVRSMMSRWAPQAASTSTMPLQKVVLGGQPDQSAVQLAAADGATAQAASPQAVAPTAAAASPELTQLMQTVETMARDLANVEQTIEQLKANQARMASDNASALDQLRIKQEEMTGLIGKVFDQTLRLTSAAVPRPTPTPHKPTQVPQAQAPHSQAPQAQAPQAHAAAPPRQARALPRSSGQPEQ
jgi:hypothetical protein